MGIRETFKEMDKMKACVVALLALTFASTTVSAYQTVKVRELLENNGAPQPKVARGHRNDAKQPTKKPSEYKFGEDYNKSLKDKKPMALLFYADWCHFCVGFMPIYEKMYKQYKNKYNFVKINVEDPNYKEVVSKYQIQGFPTLFLVNPKDFEGRIHVPNRNFSDDNIMKKTFDDFHKNNI
ncbi:conjugal transfer protein TraF [bacterium]|nr:conjugal transfer protein TraF [bacterium]